MTDTVTIAVVCSNFDFAREWLGRAVPLERVNLLRQEATSMTGQRYVFVQTEQRARGFRFDSFLVSPDYESLIDVARRQTFKRG